DLHVRYGQLHAVRGIDLTVDAGEIVAVLGSNGAGKSSTLNAIAGAVAHSGSVRFNGADTSRLKAHHLARRGLILVPEGRHIIGPLTVQENLLLGAYGLRSRQRQQEILAMVLEMFPILKDRA